MIQVEQSIVYSLAADAKRQCVADEVRYLERLVNARKLFMEQRGQMRCEQGRCEQSISHVSKAIDLLDTILADEAQFSEHDRGA